ncbi:MAG: molybdate ABC transporter substrate-binding protein [Thiobacillaceae bacterium]
MIRQHLTALALTLATLSASAAETTVAVAANFAEPMKQIAADFERASGHVVKLSTGATGKFYAQIVNGAPFDVLLAADDETPAKLIAEKHAVAGSAFTYASGKLVLWSAKPGFIDNDASALKTGNFTHLSIANARLAPYGRAALETLAALKLDVPPAKIVTGENIAQTYQFVASGNAELGFVALSQVWKDGKLTSGSGWIVPPALHAPIQQDAVLLEKGRDNAAAVALLAYLKSPAARAVVERYGYGN